MSTMRNLPSWVFKRAWRAIFQPAARYPADPRAVFVLALSVFGGLTAMLLQAAPESLEALLPRWGVMTWGFLLTGGSALTLIGMAFQNINGIIAEQIGNMCVSVTTVFYSILAFMIVGPSTIQNVGIILAWGLACGLRYIQLQALINSAFRTKVHDDALQQFRQDVEDGFNEDRS